ncbi:EamA family transporter [Pokkaliibacter plantistimulans]|uniref:EamA family transporter n=1 Tax=Proteobacteria bacterium 228 TaxID=2083153 RepID=A0A2S5KM57_9PROT|nr:EamA family transporter [Pokkaliibacter plantistimulans]PPC75914.1 EamA family transporter [Pokkaliibacter plantistimulans]
MAHSIHLEKQSRHGVLAVLLASFLWGTTGTVASFASQLSPLAIGAFAMGVGGLLQALQARSQLRQDIARLLQVKPRLLLGGMAIAVYPLAFYSSMKLAGVAAGTVISIATAPFATVVLECVLTRNNTINRRWLISFALGVVGVVMLTSGNAADAAEGQSQTVGKMIGVLLGLVAGVAYAIYAWLAKSMIDQGIPSESAMSGMFAIGAAVLIPSLLLTGQHLFASVHNILVVSYMALVPMFIGYLAFGFGLRYVNASKATLLTLFEPVVAAVLAVVIVGEQISLLGWAGIALIMFCLFLQARGS